MRFFGVLLLAASLTIAASTPPSPASANSVAFTDYDWQALYIFKLSLSYVEWPEITYANDIKVVTICIFGENPAFVKSLKNLQSKFADKLIINIRVLENDDVRGCNIAYVPHSRQNYKDIIANVGNAPVLTVAPIAGFASNNGMIEFVISETKDSAGGAPFNSKVKVSFKVNNKIAAASNLKIDPILFEASHEVIR